jgi:hypothetical protein
VVTAGENNRPGVSRLLPILTWLPGYDRAWLRGDVAAGIAVTALIVPKNLGYAGIAGVPLQNGLYAAAAGAIIYALFGTSRQISTGPSSRWRRWLEARCLPMALPATTPGVGCGNHARCRRPVPPARGAAVGVDRAVSPSP